MLVDLKIFLTVLRLENLFFSLTCALRTKRPVRESTSLTVTRLVNTSITQGFDQSGINLYASLATYRPTVAVPAIHDPITRLKRIGKAILIVQPFFPLPS